MASDLDEKETDLADQDADVVAELVHDEDEPFDDYRSLSGMAVSALIVGVVSPLAFVAPFMLLLPLVGMVLGVLAILKIRREPDYYTGSPFALIGIALSLILATSAGAMHTILGSFEVPDGYEVISFWDLQPDRNHPESPIPPSALDLDGRKVFVKGYVFPGTRRTDLKKFVLVPDMKSCCFGKQPALTDMIEVTLVDPLRAEFAYRRRGLGGTLRVHPELKRKAELTGVYYELEADYLK